MEEWAVVSGLGVGMACGLLIGLDRERTSEPDAFGGIRTYPLFALLGGLSWLLVEPLGAWVVGFAFMGLIMWVGIYYFMQSSRGGQRGLTSESAALVTFFCGVMAARGSLGLAFGVAVAVTTILALKDFLHNSVRRLTREDMAATLKFLVVSFVVLPLLPRETWRVTLPEELSQAWFGHTGQMVVEVLTPSKVGWMVVLIASISFAGFVASKLLSARRGLGLTAFLGGLASSTAVTLSFAGRAREVPALVDTCAVAILVASTTMFFRVIVEVATVAPALVGSILKPVGAMGLAGLALCGVFLLRRDKEGEEGHDRKGELKLSNPFELGQALKFGAIFAVVQLVAGLAQQVFGDSGLYVSGVVTGVTDVDAITLSVAQLTRSEVDPVSHDVAALTITIASISNTVAKGSLAWWLGGRALGLRLMGAVAIIALVGVAVALWG